MLKDKIIIYCDGACSGNPGPGGWGSVVYFGNKDWVQELTGSHPKTTNNRMEMSAALSALIACLNSKNLSEITTIQIFTDSVYLIRGITQWIFGWKKRGWKTAENGTVLNQDIWEELDQVVQQLKKKSPTTKLEWNFVKGHSGVAGNERCDVLAVASSKNDYVDLYEGSASEYSFDITELPVTRELSDPKKKSNEPKKPAWYISYINGVFESHKTWSECEAKVKGRPAKFKKVTSLEEEAQVKKTWGIS